MVGQIINNGMGIFKSIPILFFLKVSPLELLLELIIHGIYAFPIINQILNFLIGFFMPDSHKKVYKGLKSV